MRKITAFALILLGLGIILAMISFDKGSFDGFGTEPVFEEKSVKAESIDSINIETSSLNVMVIQGTSNEIKARLDGDASKKYVDRFKLEVKEKGSEIEISGGYNDVFMFGFNIINVNLIVELPEKLWNTVEVKVSSGNIEIDQLQADTVRAETLSGNLELEDITATTLNINASSGNIEADSYKADQVTVRSSSGNITLEDGIGIVDGKTSSGNIRLTTDELLHNVTLKSSSGDIRIDVTKEPQSANIYYKTSSGSRQIEWASFKADNENEDEVSGTIGSGDIRIDITTSSGNMRLGKR